MGYEIHIVRRTDFENPEAESNISPDEWKALVDADAELSWEGSYNDTSAPFEMAYWQTFPNGDPENLPWFSYSHGMISTKWTDTPVLYKMLQMAEKLNAQVRGDEDEEYNTESIKHLESSRNTASKAKKKPFWKFWG